MEQNIGANVTVKMFFGGFRLRDREHQRYNKALHVLEIIQEHSHQTLKKAVRVKNLDVYEGYLRGILGWLRIFIG